MKSFVTAAAVLLSLGAGSASMAYPRRSLDSEVSLEIGYFEPRGSSDLWKQNQRDLTMDTTDFGDAIYGARVGTSLNDFVTLDVGLSYYDQSVQTEDRRFVTPSGAAIEQNLRLRLLPVTATFKLMPFGKYSDSRGRPLQRLIPYVGVGGGAMIWRYRERGDFVDPVSLTSSPGRFRSRGIAGEYHAVVGVDVVVNQQSSLYVEGKWSRSKDDLGSDFQGFNKFDLSGDSISVGTRIRF